jgi:hypothetical protein
MNDQTVNLTVRCPIADPEIIDRLRFARSRAPFLRTLFREAAPCA